jgi:NAD(P)-dependent dehydrogenase (short-subunit alcohol dehydrogenase family)
VILTSRSQTAAEEAAEAIGSGVVGMAAHAADPAAAQACVDRAFEEFGRIDILINNAATAPPFGPLVEIDHAAFAETMNVNLWAPILWSTLTWRRWMRDHGGAIVNIVSIGGLEVAAGLGVYHASKAALIHLTRHLAVEMAPRVRVNAIAPGVVRTEMSSGLWSGNEKELAAEVPLGRLAEPADVAPAAVFLCTDAARWITGEVLVVDGGERLGKFEAAPGSD